MSAPTRWEIAAEHSEHGYGAHFAQLVDAGADIHGEARLADLLLPRGGRVLDAGSGMGRVAAELQRRGFAVNAIEKDPRLVAQSRATYPELPVECGDLFDLDPNAGPYDLVVAVGNVLIYLAEGSERAVLGRFAEVLAEGGRVLVGFHPQQGPHGARAYPPAEFEADATAAGLVVEHRFGTYDLRPPTADYCVYVLSARARRATPGSTR